MQWHRLGLTELLRVLPLNTAVPLGIQVMGLDEECSK